MDDDEFFLNDDELAEDNEIGLVGDAKLSLINKFSEILDSMKKNVQFNEKGDYDANLQVLSEYLSQLISLSELEANGEDFSNEALMEKIEEVFKRTTLITMKNIDSIIPEEKSDTVETGTASDSSEGDLDW